MRIQIKAAILGAGYIGGVHAANLRSMEGVTLAAVCDQQIEKAERLKSDLLLSGIKLYTDFDVMLRDCDFDVLYIGIPPFAHNDQLEKAAAMGKHIFIEKPIALTTFRARSMVESIRNAGVISQVGYHARFGYAVQKLKQLINTGEAGIPVLFDGRYDCNSTPDSWWIDRTKSGGQVFEQAIHTYDMAMYFLGEPENLTGMITNMCHQNTSGYTIEDNSVSAIRFKSGGLASISATNCAVPMEWNNSFTIVLEKMTAYFHDPNQAEFVFTDSNNIRRVKINGSNDMYLEADKTFIAAVRGETSPFCPIEEGYKSLCLVESIMKSADQNGRNIVCE